MVRADMAKRKSASKLLSGFRLVSKSSKIEPDLA